MTRPLLAILFVMSACATANADGHRDILEAVKTAKLKANLNYCLIASPLCDESLLEGESQKDAVREAKLKANLNYCLIASPLCDESLLEGESQKDAVREAKLKANLNYCLMASPLCDESLLELSNKDQDSDLKLTVPNAQLPTIPLQYNSGACAENGSCYGDLSTATGKPKTTRVQGYYRADGTYVRGHYRSK